MPDHQVEDQQFDSEVPRAPKKGKILIVEDILTNRMFLTSLLETLDIEVLIAENGKKAVDIFKSDPTITDGYSDASDERYRGYFSHS